MMFCITVIMITILFWFDISFVECIYKMIKEFKTDKDYNCCKWNAVNIIYRLVMGEWF